MATDSHDNLTVLGSTIRHAIDLPGLEWTGGVHESMGSVRGRGPAARSAGLGSRCGVGGAVHDEQSRSHRGRVRG